MKFTNDITRYKHNFKNKTGHIVGSEGLGAHCVKANIEVRWWRRKFALFWELAKGRNLEAEILSKG